MRRMTNPSSFIHSFLCRSFPCLRFRPGVPIIFRKTQFFERLANFIRIQSRRVVATVRLGVEMPPKAGGCSMVRAGQTRGTPGED